MEETGSLKAIRNVVGTGTGMQHIVLLAVITRRVTPNSDAKIGHLCMLVRHSVHRWF